VFSSGGFLGVFVSGEIAIAIAQAFLYLYSAAMGVTPRSEYE
jgi:hypothetical protein